MQTAVQKIGLAIFGVCVAVASALAWRYWNIPGIIAFLFVLSGAGMTAAAFGYKGE